MRNSLSEIFIQALNENYSDKSVGVALIKCDQILKKELEIVHSEEEFVEYFFDSDGEELKINNKGTELFAFWDVFREFYEILNRVEFGPDLIILKTIAEVDFLNKSILNEEVKNNISESYITKINEVVNFINDLKDKTEIKITILEGNTASYEKVIPLDEIRDESDMYIQVFFENLVMDLVHKMGIIEVKMGNGKNVYIALKEDDWRIIKKESFNLSDDV